MSFFLGERFKTEVDRYLRKGLHKGVPPLFVDLRSLYKDKAKATVIEELLDGYVSALVKTGRFSEEGEINKKVKIIWIFVMRILSSVV